MKLWPGQFVNVRLLLDTRHDAVMVPSTRRCCRAGADRFAYAVKADQHRRDPVSSKVEQVRDSFALVTAGLTAGDTIGRRRPVQAPSGRRAWSNKNGGASGCAVKVRGQ